MQAPFDDGDFLTVQIGGSPGVVARLLLIARPQGGRVCVRRWTSHTLNTPGETVELDATAMREEIETAYEARLPVSVEMAGIRQWLAGLPVGR
jgi:hypothetical protein